jgi:ABC-type uncharacterized transport system permease subunit
VIHILALLLYIGAFILWIHVLVRGARGARLLPAALATVAAVVLHGAALIRFRLVYGELPLVGPGAALSTLAFVGGVALVAFLPLRHAARLALVLLPFITAVLGSALWMGIEPSPLALEFQGTAFVLHVGFAFLGYQGMAVAFAAGMLYLMQHHELKSKRLGALFHFIPPLAVLDRISRVGLWAGFGCLSVALAFGWWWTIRFRGTLDLGDPKVIWAVLSWIVFVAMLGARWGPGRTEYRGALASVVGFGVVVASFLALRITAGGDGLFL